MNNIIDIYEFFDLIQDSIKTFHGYSNYFQTNGGLIQLNNHTDLVIVGDLHGDYKSLKKILDQINIGTGEARIIFLGDYVDRGPNQLEVLTEVLKLSLDHPDEVVLLRGNHEGPKDIPCIPSDFKGKILTKFGEEGKNLLKKIQQLYDSMPHSVYVKSESLMLHGGIPTTATSIDEIALAHKTHPKKPYLEEILWNDPTDKNGSYPSPRGAGKLFGPDVTRSFLKTIGARTLIRGHESTPQGYKIDFNSVVTLFSCKIRSYSNYSGTYLRMPKKTPFSIKNIVPRIRKI